MATKQVYDESKIKVLQGLEAVRKRPGMYIGSTDARGLHHLIWEIVDNSIDEVLAGEANNIKVTIKKDNSVEVQDNGRGVPIGMHATGKPTPQVVFCELHAGGKFSEDGGYRVSSGLHGVGSSAVNALSTFMEVTIHKDKKIYYQLYENGGSIIHRHKILGETKAHGTTVHFKPDPEIFSTTLIDYKTCANHLRENAFLNKGLKIELTDERSGQAEVFYYKDGVRDYLLTLCENKERIHEPIFIEGTSGGIEVEAAIQYCAKTYSENVLSFANNVRTHDGGTHEVGFKSAITKSFNDYARMKGLLKDKDPNLEGMDIREGMTAIISVRIPEDLLQFEGQTKSKLGSIEAKTAVETVINEKLSFYLAEKGEVASLLVNNALKALKVREAAREARDNARMVKQKVSNKVTNLAGKLTPCEAKNASINELFLVEGDSAGGSAKQGRDRTFQAILPLRGKVLNSEKTNPSELLKNEEILSMIYSIGAGFGEDFNANKSNFNKVIIMTDADDDGAHIQILLLTFFFRYMRGLIEAGKVYIALPPLYKVSNKNQIEYAWTDDELEEKCNLVKNYTIQRFKGLGEMNFEQLWDTTMNPETRTLIQVKIEDFYEADDRVSLLMGDDSDARKDWIETNISFDQEDNFTLEEANPNGSKEED